MSHRKLRPATSPRLAHRAMALVAVGLCASFALGSCADVRPPRSFVQPDVIKKSDLEGTFYYLQTVTDAPPTNGAMFMGQSSSLLKIKFDIQQGFLYARRAYPQIDNAEDNAAEAGPDYKGAPIAAWAITGQFDIIRDYNPTTGEQTNAIIESMERPWQERDFIRVNWSQNLVTDYIGLGIDLFFSDGQPQVQGVSYWESDPTKPDALHIEHLTADSCAAKDADGKCAVPGGLKAGDMSYLDVTNQLVVTPEFLTIEDQGQVFSYPKCFFGYMQEDCASQVIKVKHAFAKIDPKHDYEPRAWDGNQMNMFGVWDVGLRRLSYNSEYGITNSGASRRAARFNIWEKSYDADGNLIEPKDRVLKKIPYYAEGSLPVTYQGDTQFPDGMKDRIYPPELFTDFQFIIGSWNDAMKVAVKDATGSEAPHDIFVACHNPVRNEDDPACKDGLQPLVDASGKAILDKNKNPIVRARQGDPRRSNVFWVNEPQAAGPLGYGPPMYDEITGETISGQAYIYGASLLSYAARSRDLMLLLNGDISSEDFVDGKNVKEWVNAHKLGIPYPPAVRQTFAQRKTLSQSDVNAAAAAMDFSWAKGFTPENGYPALDVASLPRLQESMKARQNAIYKGFYQYGMNNRSEQLKKLVDTPMEKFLVTAENMAAGGVSPMYQWSDLSTTQKRMVSPLRQAAYDKAIMQMRIGAEIRGVDFQDQFEDHGLEQRLRYYKKLYNLGSAASIAEFSEQIRLDLIHQIYRAVTLHEVGHNMGCRHNFRASYDAMNYTPTTKVGSNPTQPGYWDIRMAALDPDKRDPGAVSDGKIHPRYVNKAGGAISQYELNNRIQEFQYSSIMDYGSEFNSDLEGLGLYDKAHIKFSYAGYVEVFTDARADVSSKLKFSSLSTYQNSFGFPSPLGTGVGLTAIPYHTYPSLFKHGKDGMCGVWSQETGCQYRTDVPYSSLKQQSVTDPSTGYSSTYLADARGNPVVPYYFCSDEFAGNLTCQRFDAGADAYEQASDLISRYNNFYLFNNFKRDRAKFYTSSSYKSRIAGRYFALLRQQLVWYVLLRGEFESFLSRSAQTGGGGAGDVVSAANTFFTDEEGWGNFTAAVTSGFDLLGQVLATPDAGVFYKTSNTFGDTPHWVQLTDATTYPDPICINGNGAQCLQQGHTVGLLDGKYSTTTWDFDTCGYYWGDECQKRIGYLIDKQIALDVLSESQAYFTGRDTNVDVRTYAIGYVLPFKSQLEDKLGALLSSDIKGFAPYFKKTGETQVVNGQTQPVYGIVQPSWVLANPDEQKGDPSDELEGIIDPSAGFTLSMYAGVYALSAFPSTFDHDFVDNTKIFVVGNGEAPVADSLLLDPSNPIHTSSPSDLVSHKATNPSAVAEWLVVTDPINGQTYAAHAVPVKSLTVPDANSSTGETFASAHLRADIGVRMLETFQNYAQAYSDALAEDPSGESAKVSFTKTRFQNFRENIQIMRSLHATFGYGPYSTSTGSTY